MAIAIVEELWTRIRAAIDDKIVVATDARDQSVTAAGDAAVSATAAAGFATDAGDAAVRAETAADNAEVGIAPDSVLRTMLEPAIRLELDGLRADVDGVSPSWSGITDKPATFPPEGHDHPAVEISDSSVVGRSVLTAVDAAAARLAIGAGTSNLALGSTASTAAKGDHTHTPESIGAAPASHTHSQYAESSRVTALEDSQPIIVSSLPTSPLPGRIYLVTGG